MKKTKLELCEKLLLTMNEYNKDRKVINTVVKFMVEKGVAPGKVVGIINQNQNIPIQTVSELELKLLLVAFFNATKEPRLTPDRWLNPDEIVEVEKYHAQSKKDNNIVALKKVTKIRDNQYVCPAITYQEIANYWSSGKWSYNKNIQRETTKRIVDGEVVEFATIYEDSVEDIYKKMLIPGKFTPNTLTLVILKTGGEKFKYDEKTGDMKIEVDNVESFLNLADGAHRTCGVIKAVEEKPDIDGIFILNILHYTEEEAKEYVKQESLHNDISEEVLATYASENPYMELVKEINKEGSLLSNAMYQNIGITMQDVTYGGKYVTMQTLALAIEENFKFTNAREGRIIKKFIIEGFNDIIGIFENDFKNIKESREINYITYNNMFIGYIALLSKLQNRDNWHDSIEEILNEIDFNKINALWKDLRIGSSTINPTIVRKISNHFISILKKDGDTR
jgi:hypothetical protein